MRTPFASGVALALALPAIVGAQAPAARSTAATPSAAVALTRTPRPRPAARPLPGRWVATVTNGSRGDAVRFTVSPDGAELRDVQFVGSWRCGAASVAGTLEQAQGGPPKPVPVSAGTFESVQTRVAWWWETMGRFTSATSAEGTYRQAAKNAGCDTQRLRWTARRIGD